MPKQVNSNKAPAPKKQPVKKAAVPKGAVGFMYGGVLRVGAAYLFYNESESEVNETYEAARNYLGRYITCKYFPVENASEVFEQLQEQFSSQHDYSNIYMLHCGVLTEKMKETSGVERCKILKEKDEEVATVPKQPTKKTGKKPTVVEEHEEEEAEAEEEEAEEEEAEAEEEEEEETVAPPPKKKSNAPTKAVAPAKPKTPAKEPPAKVTPVKKVGAKASK